MHTIRLTVRRQWRYYERVATKEKFYYPFYPITVCNFVVHDRCLKAVVSPCSSIAASLIKVPPPLFLFLFFFFFNSPLSKTHYFQIITRLIAQRDSFLRIRLHTVGPNRYIAKENFATSVGKDWMIISPYIAKVSRIVFNRAEDEPEVR